MTTPLGFRYPAGTDSPAGMTQIQNLATDIDTWLQANATVRSYYILTRTGGNVLSVSASGATMVGGYDGTTWTQGSTITFGSGVLTAGKTGVYDVFAAVGWPAVSISSVSDLQVGEMTVFVNGTASIFARDYRYIGTHTRQVSVYAPQPLNNGDTVQLGLQAPDNGSPLANVQPWAFGLIGPK